MGLSCTRYKNQYITLRTADMVVSIRLAHTYEDAAGLRIPPQEGLTINEEGQGDLYIVDLNKSLELIINGHTVRLEVKEVRESWMRIKVHAPQVILIDQSGSQPDKDN